MYIGAEQKVLLDLEVKTEGTMDEEMQLSSKHIEFLDFLEHSCM